MLSLPGAQVQSLVGELRFHKLRGEAKKKETGKFMVALFDVTQQSQSIILICSQYRKLLRYFASL